MAAISCCRRYARPTRTVVFRRQLRSPVTKPTRATDRRCAGPSPRSARRSHRHPPHHSLSPAIPYCAVFPAKYVIFRRESAARDYLYAHRAPKRSRPRSASRFRRAGPSFPLQLSVLVGHFASAESPGDDTRRVEGLRASSVRRRVRSAKWSMSFPPAVDICKARLRARQRQRWIQKDTSIIVLTV